MKVKVGDRVKIVECRSLPMDSNHEGRIGKVSAMGGFGSDYHCMVAIEELGNISYCDALELRLLPKRPIGRPRKEKYIDPVLTNIAKFLNTPQLPSPIDVESSSVAIANKVNELISFLEGKYK